MAFSPDGKSLASASSDNSIKLWDASSGSLLRTLSGHSNTVSSVAFSPDGKSLASASDDNSIKLWDASSGSLLRTLSGHSRPVSSVAFSPDGKSLASASSDNSIKLWDASSGSLLRTLSGHSLRVLSVAFSPDGKSLASASDDNSIKLWDASSGSLLRTLSGHSNTVSSVAFSPDGKSLASASYDSSIKLWDASSGSLLRTLSGHSSFVLSVAFSPDGKSLASASSDNSIRLWDASSTLTTLVLALLPRDEWIAFHPATPLRYVSSRGGDEQAMVRFGTSLRPLLPLADHRPERSFQVPLEVWTYLGLGVGVLVYAALTFAASTLHKRAWWLAILALPPIAATGVAGNEVQATRPTGPEVRMVLQVGHSNTVTSVAFSPDGKSLASASWDNSIKLWDASSGSLLRTLSGHSDSVTSVAFSPDGKSLASASYDNSIKLWDASSGSLLRTLSGHSNTVSSVAFSPDGKSLASASYDNSIKLWDASSGSLLRTLSGHSLRVTSVAFSPDGKSLASASSDSSIKLWDTSSGSLLRTLSGHSNTVTSVAFSPDGKSLASASYDNSIKLWDASSGSLLRTLSGHSRPVTSVAFSPDGKSLASASSDSSIKLWDTSSGSLFRTLSGHSNTVSSIAFSPNGKSLASASSDNSIKLWDASSGSLFRTLSGHSDSVSSVAFSPDGKSLASASSDNSIKLWDASSGSLLRTLSGHSNTVSSVAFSPDGKSLASASDDNSIKLWDASSGSLLRTLSGHSRPVSSVAFSPDGKSLASASSDNSIKLWDASSGSLLRTLSGHSRPVSSVAFSPDGKSLASASSDNSIKLWDASSGSLLRTLSGHSNTVSSVAFSPDGKSLASASSDNSIKLWDASSGSLLRTLSGHSNTVSSVAFSPDGKSLASASDDNSIKLWDASSGSLLRTLSGHSRPVSSVAFSPDGKSLASASSDNSIRLWDASSTLATLVLALLPRDEWIAFHPTTLRYVSSRGGDEQAMVRFGTSLRPLYPLTYYHSDLQAPAPSLAEPSAISPSPLRLYWDSVPNAGAWVSVSSLLYVLLGALSFVLVARADPLVVAQEFFKQSGFARVKDTGSGLMTLVDSSGAAHLAMRWSGGATGAPRHLMTATPGVPRKTYALYEGEAPNAHELQRFAATTASTVIPLRLQDLRRAVAQGNCHDRLRDLEERHLVRADPYDDSVPVDDPVWFYGRRPLLDQLPGILKQSQHVALLGLRKVGKTSLVKQLQGRLQNVPVIFIDCQAYRPVAEDFLDAILQGLLEQLQLLGVRGLLSGGDNPPGGRAFGNELARLYGAWRASGGLEPFVVVLDEADKLIPDRRQKGSEDALIEYVRLFRVLRAASQERRSLSLLVTAYRPDVNRQNLLSPAVGENPMHMSYQEHFLGFFEAAETVQMLVEIGGWKGIEWEEGAAARVHELCGGHPMLSRYFASDACEKGQRRRIDLARVEAVADSVLNDPAGHRIRTYFRESVWAVLGETERTVLVAAARDGSLEVLRDASRRDDDRMDATANLLHFGLLARPSGDRLRVSGELLSRWLQHGVSS